MGQLSRFLQALAWRDYQRALAIGDDLDDETKRHVAEYVDPPPPGPARVQTLPPAPRILHVLPSAIRDGGPAVVVRDAAKPATFSVYHGVEWNGPSALHRATTPLPGTDGRGLVYITTDAALRVYTHPREEMRA
jgi:hypothetical protein